MRYQDDAVDGDPDEEDRAKRDEKFPTTAKLSDVVGESLAKGQLFLELFADVAGENLMLLQAFDDFMVKGGKLADLLLQNIFHVILSEFAQVIETDEPLAVQGGCFFLDELEKRWSNQFRHHSAVGRFRLFAYLTDL